MPETDLLELVEWMSPALGVPCSCALMAIDYCDSTGRKLNGHSEKLETLTILLHNLIAGVVIEHNKGVLVKFTGDGCLGAFTGPQGPANAITAALDIRRRIRSLNADLREKARVFTKVGLHKGSVWLVDYKALTASVLERPVTARYVEGLTCNPDLFPIPAGDPHGSSVDLTFRVMSYASKGQILATTDLFDAIGSAADSMLVSDVHVISAKGKPEGMAVREIALKDDKLVGIVPVHRQIEWQSEGPVLDRLKSLHDIAHNWASSADEFREATFAVYSVLESDRQKTVFLRDEGQSANVKTIKDRLGELRSGSATSPARAIQLIRELESLNIGPAKLADADDIVALQRTWGAFERSEVGANHWEQLLDEPVRLAAIEGVITSLLAITQSMARASLTLLMYADDGIRHILGLPKESSRA